MFSKLIVIILIFSSAPWAMAQEAKKDNKVLVKIKNISDIQGPRNNILTGIGIVTGLQGTGDGSNVARRAMANMLKKYNLNVSLSEVATNNAAIVKVRGVLTPGLRNGNTVDVTVTSMFDASSLVGGVLTATPLTGGSTDVTYAVAEGPIMVGGFSAAGAASSVKKNHTTVGSIPDGATIEKELPVQLQKGPRSGIIEFTLRSPDFRTAASMAEAINKKYKKAARAKDMKTVEVKIPKGFDDNNLVSFVADLQDIRVTPDAEAKVIINERTGTIVAGSEVRISTVAITHGSLIISIAENTEVSQPQPLSDGKTTETKSTDLQVTEEPSNFVVIDSNSSVSDLAQALNAIGATPRDLVIIFQQIKMAGALHAKLEIMG